MASSSSSSSGVVDMSQFEMAVMIVRNPSSQEAFLEASNYIQQLSTLPDSYMLCMQLLLGASSSDARFFALQALEPFTRDPAGYASLPSEEASTFREGLLVYVQSRGADLLAEEAYVRTKLAVVLALIIKADYPTRWPTAFHDLVGLAQSLASTSGVSSNGGPASSSSTTSSTSFSSSLSAAGAGPSSSLDTSADETRAALAGVDLLVRVLGAIYDEFVDVQIDRSFQDTATGTQIKDDMRASGHAALVIDTLLGVVSGFVDAIGSTAGAGPELIKVTQGALSVLASYASWVDIRLLVGEPQAELYLRILGLPDLRLQATLLLFAIVDKGMDDAARLVVVRSLRLIDVCGMLVEGVEAAFGGGAGSKTNGGGSGGTRAGSAAATTARGSGFDADDNELNEAVARLVSAVSTAVLVGGETSVVLENQDACAWTADALRATADYSFRLLEVGHVDYGVGNAMLGFAQAIAVCVAKEQKAAARAAGGGSGGGSGGGGGGGGATGPASPSFRPLSGNGGPGPTPLSLPASAAAGVGGDAGISPSRGSTGGRPAGVSCGEFVPRLLHMVAQGSAFPEDFSFLSMEAAAAAAQAAAAAAATGGVVPASFDGPVGGDADDEEEQLVLLFREGLKKVFFTLVRAAQEGVLAELGTGVLSPDVLSALPSVPWPQAEVALLLLYTVGDANASAVNASLRTGTGTFSEMLAAALTSGAQGFAHHAVATQYFDVAVRYHYLMVQRPDILPLVLQAMVGESGLRHPHPAVRARVAYLLGRLVRSMCKGGNGPAESTLLAPYLDNILEGVHEFLAIPFVQPATGGAAGGGGGAAAAGAGKRSPAKGNLLLLASPVPTNVAAAIATAKHTRGPSGLGSQDAEYIFELVGALLSQPWVQIEQRVSYVSAVMNPLLTSLEEGLAALGVSSAAAGASSSGGTTAARSSARSVPAAPISSPEFVAAIAAWAVRILHGVAQFSRGLGNVASIEPLAVLAEQALDVALRVAMSLSAHAEVRGEAVFLLQRMVDCLGPRMLPHVPAYMPTIIGDSSPAEVRDVLTLLRSLTLAFKTAAAPLLASCLIPILSQVAAAMQLPAEPVPVEGGGGGGSAAASAAAAAATPRRRLRLIPRKESVDLSAGSGNSADGDGGVEDDAAARDAAAARVHLDLQRSYASFLQALAMFPSVATQVLTTPPNDEELGNVLTSAVALATTADDPTAQRTVLIFFTLLIRSWLPLSSGGLPALPGMPGSASATSTSTGASTAAAAAGGMSTPSTATSTPIAGATDASSSSSSSVAIASPSPLSEGLLSLFVPFVLEEVLRASFLVAANPEFKPTDPACIQLVGEALTLQATISLHVRAASEAPWSPGAVDPTAVLAESTLPSLGCPPHVAEGFVGVLRQNMGQPKEAKDAYFAVIKALEDAAAGAV